MRRSTFVPVVCLSLVAVLCACNTVQDRFAPNPAGPGTVAIPATAHVELIEADDLRVSAEKAIAMGLRPIGGSHFVEFRIGRENLVRAAQDVGATLVLLRRAPGTCSTVNRTRSYDNVTGTMASLPDESVDPIPCVDFVITYWKHVDSSTDATGTADLAYVEGLLTSKPANSTVPNWVMTYRKP